MKPSEVKQKWPKAYSIAEKMIANGDSIIATIKKIRDITKIDLVDAKRIILSIESNVSLEDHEDELAPIIKQALDELDENGITND